MLKGKTIVLGVTGSIAAYKIANLASALVKLRADVHVIMTQNATHFIHPTAFETLTGNKCMVDTFDRNFQFNISHVSLATRADLLLIAPASANIIGKLANGIADDMLSTTAMAMTCPVLISPAMNVNMFHNSILQENLQKLEQHGKIIIQPDCGYLACGVTGDGKMPDPSVLLEYILREAAYEKDLAGKKVLITAGPTREAIDPVRFITNHSTGKMGYALAKQAMLRGADVTLVTGPTSIDPPPFVKVIPVTSANDMYLAVKDHWEEQDMFIMSAAVADYRPQTVHDEKVKKKEGDLSLSLERTTDILKWLGEVKKEHQLICGFSMETENLIENSRAKLKKKNADFIAANSLREEGAGFSGDTNHIILIGQEETIDIPMASKDEVAFHILSALTNK